MTAPGDTTGLTRAARRIAAEQAQNAGSTAPDATPATAAPDPGTTPRTTTPRTTTPRTTTPRTTTRSELFFETVGPIAERAARRTRAILRVARPAAWILIAVAAILWIVGLSLGWWEVVLAAVVVTAVLLLCLIFLVGGTAYDVGLDLTRTRVVVGERAVGALTLANRTGRSILPSRVVLPVGSGRGVFDVPRLAPGENREELFAIPTQRRGVLAVGPVSVLRGDPLGLFERVHDRRQAVDLFVHPRTTDLSGLSLGRLRDLEGLPATDLSRDDVSFHALREYQPGDDLRHVHWRSTARVGQLMMRQYEETRRSHFVVGLSTLSSDYRDPDEFELAISVAGSIGLRAFRDSRTLECRVPGRVLPSSSGRHLLDALSALEHSKPRLGGIVGVAGALAAHASGASVAVLVAGSGVSSADLRIACARLPQEVRTLAIVAEKGASASLRRIGNADVVTVGALDDLGGAVRRVLS